METSAARPFFSETRCTVSFRLPRARETSMSSSAFGALPVAVRSSRFAATVRNSLSANFTSAGSCCHSFQACRLTQWRQKLVNQVTMRGVDFDDAKTSVACATRPAGKSGNNFLYTIKRERFRHRIIFGNGIALGAITLVQPPSLLQPLPSPPTADACSLCVQHAPIASRQYCLAHERS